MKKIKKILNTLAVAFSGMLFMSIYVTQTDNWKYYLPICLSSIAFRQSLNDD